MSGHRERLGLGPPTEVALDLLLGQRLAREVVGQLVGGRGAVGLAVVRVGGLVIVCGDCRIDEVREVSIDARGRETITESLDD